VSKKLIIIASAAALLTFTGAFFGARMLGRKTTLPATTETTENKTSEAKPSTSTTKPQAGSSKSAEAELQAEAEAEAAKGLTEKQLKSLVYEVREKINDYEIKQRELEVKESRLQMTQDTLKKDIETLTQLRVELATMVANLKEQRSQLLATRTTILKNEKANLTSIALTYDKMDPAGASKIIGSMCARQLESGKTEGGNIDDAVKILFYMNERSKGKLLGEIVSTEPKLAAILCQRLKKVVEQE
jgi:membrane-associated HD superfamily phosphohydrolase